MVNLYMVLNNLFICVNGAIIKIYVDCYCGDSIFFFTLMSELYTMMFGLICKQLEATKDLKYMLSPSRYL